jgi:hypothetical protein
LSPAELRRTAAPPRRDRLVLLLLMSLAFQRLATGRRRHWHRAEYILARRRLLLLLLLGRAAPPRPAQCSSACRRSSARSGQCRVATHCQQQSSAPTMRVCAVSVPAQSRSSTLHCGACANRPALRRPPKGWRSERSQSSAHLLCCTVSWTGALPRRSLVEIGSCPRSERQRHLSHSS